jgi:hypothetical protein
MKTKEIFEAEKALAPLLAYINSGEIDSSDDSLT